jgi:hypothetical protein
MTEFSYIILLFIHYYKQSMFNTSEIIYNIWGVIISQALYKAEISDN